MSKQLTLRRILQLSFAVVATATLAASAPAAAATITYSFSADASATFGPPFGDGPVGKDTISGNFTVDTLTFDESNVSITLTLISGTDFPGTYTQLTLADISTATVIEATLGSELVEIIFGSPLNGAPAPITGVIISNLCGSPPIFCSVSAATGPATGSAIPMISAVPLPAALPLFATGLGALGLLGWRRKRKAAALAA